MQALAASRPFFWQPVFSFHHDYLRVFRGVLVHPSQEMRYPEGAFFRGGPDWPYFSTQILARHCWGAIPRPIDSRPLPARTEWPYFDPQLLLRQLPPAERCREIDRLAEAHAPGADQAPERLATGIWCGPIILHFGHMIADFGMRIAASSHVDATTPLVFSIPPLRDIEPPPYFWQIIDHLGVDRGRVLLIRKPTRFDRLAVLPQAERPNGGGPSRRHLQLMDQIAGPPTAIERDLDCVFVSRSSLAEGRFAGECYLDDSLAAAGVTVFNPETVGLHAQLRLYRRARRLIFSEGSAVHALQLLGHLGSDVVVLLRRPWNRMAAASLRPRARSLQYLRAVRGLLHGLFPSGLPLRRAGLSVLHERRCLAGFKSVGIDLAPFWDTDAYHARRDADIAAWVAQRRATAAHPGEAVLIEKQLRALSLRG